jgi:hypothetical protein
MFYLKKIFMKKLTTLAIIAILSLSFTSCEKIHRNQYTGKWDFKVVHELGRGDTKEYDTSYYSGKISSGNTYNKINIKYKKNTSVSVKIHENGELYEFSPNHDYCFANGTGRFEGYNTLRLSLEWGGLGGECGMGSHAGDYIIGIKKEGR